MNYLQYIGSLRWRRNPARLREMAIAKGRCRLCAEKGQLEAHHRDYSNLGDEQDGDLIALCRRYQSLLPLSADVLSMRDLRHSLIDPTRGEDAR